MEALLKEHLVSVSSLVLYMAVMVTVGNWVVLRLLLLFDAKNLIIHEVFNICEIYKGDPSIYSSSVMEEEGEHEVGTGDEDQYIS